MSMKEYVKSLIACARKIRDSKISRESYRSYIQSARRANRHHLGMTLTGIREI